MSLWRASSGCSQCTCGGAGCRGLAHTRVPRKMVSDIPIVHSFGTNISTADRLDKRTASSDACTAEFVLQVAGRNDNKVLDICPIQKGITNRKYIRLTAFSG